MERVKQTNRQNGMEGWTKERKKESANYRVEEKRKNRWSERKNRNVLKM